LIGAGTALVRDGEGSTGEYGKNIGEVRGKKKRPTKIIAEITAKESRRKLRVSPRVNVGSGGKPQGADTGFNN